MAKTQNVSPPPPPPPAPVANPVDNAHGTTPDPLDSSTQSQPSIPSAPPVDNAEPVENTGSGTNPQTGVNELDGGVPAEPPTPDPVDGPNGRVTRDAELHGGVKASDYREPEADEDFDDIDTKLTDAMRADEIARRGFRAGRRGSPLGQRRKRFTDNEWARYQKSHADGKVQGDADRMSPQERVERIERALGLPIPGAVIYAEDDE